MCVFVCAYMSELGGGCVCVKIFSHSLCVGMDGVLFSKLFICIWVKWLVDIRNCCLYLFDQILSYLYLNGRQFTTAGSAWCKGPWYGVSCVTWRPSWIPGSEIKRPIFHVRLVSLQRKIKNKLKKLVSPGNVVPNLKKFFSFFLLLISACLCRKPRSTTKNKTKRNPPTAGWIRFSVFLKVQKCRTMRYILKL